MRSGLVRSLGGNALIAEMPISLPSKRVMPAVRIMYEDTVDSGRRGGAARPAVHFSITIVAIASFRREKARWTARAFAIRRSPPVRSVKEATSGLHRGEFPGLRSPGEGEILGQSVFFPWKRDA